MFVWLLCEIEWNLKFIFESCIRGNERTFPDFHLCILISLNSNSFHHQNPTVKIIWLLSFKEMKRGLKMIWIPFWNISNLETLSNSMSSWGKIKWLLHIWRKRVGTFKEINWKSLWSYLKLIFPFEVVWNSKFKFNWELFEFLFKIFFS